MSVDVVASSDVSVSLTLDKKQRETQDIPLLVVRMKKYFLCEIYQKVN